MSSVSDTEKRILVLSGPTGSGESTLTQKLIERYPDRVTRLVTSTTRDPREGEKDGVDYLFFKREDFLAKHERGEILEMTHVPQRDVYYGTYRPQLEKQLSEYDVVIANTDLPGTRYFRGSYNASTIFVMPPSMESLVSRITHRNPDVSDEELNKRLTHAKEEIAKEKPEYDHVIVNEEGELEKAVDEIVQIMKVEGYNI